MGDEDNEVGLPQKGLNMIIKDVISEMRVANESRELLNACCVEFVKHVSREAQRISADDQRKTIYHEHVQKGWWYFDFWNIVSVVQRFYLNVNNAYSSKPFEIHLW